MSIHYIRNSMCLYIYILLYICTYILYGEQFLLRTTLNTPRLSAAQIFIVSLILPLSRQRTWLTTFACYHRVARTSLPFPSSTPHSPSFYSSALPAFWSAYLLNAFAMCAWVCAWARNTNIKFHTAGIKKRTLRCSKLAWDASKLTLIEIEILASNVLRFFFVLYCFKTLRVTF